MSEEVKKVEEISEVEQVNSDVNEEIPTAPSVEVVERGTPEYNLLLSELNTLGILMGATYEEPQFSDPTPKNPRGKLINWKRKNVYHFQQIGKMANKANEIMMKLGW